MSVTLQVNGQEMTFSEEELTAILEDYFSSKSNIPQMQTEEDRARVQWVYDLLAEEA